jgi:acyl carrier protein
MVQGSSVVALLAAANRDPAQFTSDPDGFDIGRAQGRHLGFAAGRHHCIGSVDAEQAARIALTAFLDRYPTFELASGDAVTWGTHANTRCPSRVLMRVGPDTAVTAPPRPPVAPRVRRVELTDRDVAELRAGTVPPTSLTGELLWPAAVAAVAERAPARPALTSGTSTLTYERLVRTADVLAERLRHHGVEPGVVVGVLTDRSPESYIAALAVGRAGAAFLAADSTCPPERLRDMLQQSRTAVLCTQPHLLDLARSVAPAGVEVVVVDSGELASAPVPPPVLSGVNPGDPAYVVFTSGSSGRPKPIVINHLALLNLQVALRQVYRVTPDDRVLQWFSPHFDGWPFDLVTALTAGAQLVMAPTAGRCVGPILRDTLREHGVTVATLTPTAWQSCPDLGDLPALRLAASAGEPLRAGLVGELSAPGRRVLNLYGPAEAAIWSTWHDCRPADGDPPIGVPITNRRLYLLTAAGRPAPDGVVGELWIGGAGVGRYLRQPDLMQAGFAPDPLAEAPGELMYATGDLCRRRPDGSLDHVGRADRQIKLRGQRIEPEEIERALEAVAGVQSAVVELVEGRLVARVVPEPGAEVDAGVLTHHLRERLHSAMLPVIHVGGRTGMSLTGKRFVVAVDRADVRGPACPAHDPRPGRTSTAGRRLTVLTWSIARLIASRLQIPQTQIRADTDFFTLGGDSLSLSELLVAIEDDFDVVLALDDVLAQPSPAQIARLVQDAER